MSRDDPRSVDIVHVPTPLSTFSSLSGDAINTVVHELMRAGDEAGFCSAVVLHKGGWHDLGGCQLRAEFQASPQTWARRVDVGLGTVGGVRRNWGRHYQPVTDVLGPTFDRPIVLHNAAQPLRALGARIPNAALFLYAHNDLFRSFTKREAQRTLRRAEATIAVSDFLANRVVHAAPGTSDRVRVVLNGVDTQRFHPVPHENDRVSILFVGRIARRKGVHSLVEAAVRLSGSRRDFELKIVGSANLLAGGDVDDYGASLRRAATPAGDAVRFEPFSNRHKVAALMRESDVFVLPAEWDEPSPLSLLEAMASGLACVASRRGGIPEIGGAAVRYVNPENTLELADALEDLIENVSSRRELANGARERAIELDWRTRFTEFREIVLPGVPRS